MAGVALTYGQLAKLVLANFSSDGVTSIIWPPSGLALAALLLGGYRYWPGVLLGAFFGNMLAGAAPALAFPIALGNTLEALAGFWLLNRSGCYDTERMQLCQYFCLCRAAMMAALVSAVAGNASLWAAGLLTHATVLQNTLKWWQGDVLGLVLVTPMILTWRHAPRSLLARTAHYEALLCFGLAFLAGQIVFLGWFSAVLGGYAKGFILFVFVVWSAVRFGRHGTLLVIGMTAIQALVGALHGVGFFAQDYAETQLTTFWLYMLVLSMVGMALAVALEERKRREEEMRLAGLVYKTSSEAMMVTDANGTIITVNPAFTAITGYTPEEVIGNTPRVLRSNRHDAAFYQAMWGEILARGAWQGEIWDRRKSGEIYPKWLTINTTTDEDGNQLRRVALFSDISEKKRSEEVIWHQANFDPLTGLPNRRMFADRLEQEIKKAHRAKLLLALIFLDLDRFKEINDTLGHDMGDVLLVEAARRLTACVREFDTVSRLGGDEFTVIVGELKDHGSVERVAQEILRTLAQPFQLGSETVYVTTSIGITFYPDDATKIETLLKNADQAMYASKALGRNRFEFFTPSMHKASQNRLRLANDLHNALTANEFHLYYQPIVELASGAIHKAEALIRWHHPARGLINPDDFIPIAEETGTIVEIGDWVFREAARQAARWRTAHDPAFKISVNKSPVQFHRDHAGHPNWSQLLGTLGFAGDSLVVEITESALLESSPIVKSHLSGFHAAGMQVALDDFGTGYSSLSYLKKFDIDFLKIDRTFIQNLTPDSEDMALSEAIIVMAHKLGIKVIAEGVETAQQRDLLCAAGCDYAQGYLYAPPLPADAFEELLFQARPPI